jgi:PAS domain S-box-containing protein
MKSNTVTERQWTEETRELTTRLLGIANKCTRKQELLDQFVREIGKWSECEAVGIRILDRDGTIPYKAYIGFSSQFYATESPLSIHTDACMCINVIKGTTDPALPFYTANGSFYMNGTTRFLATVPEEEKGKTRNVCNQMGYESVALIPIFLNEEIIGLIHIADLRENLVPFDKVRTLEAVSSQLGIAIRKAFVEMELRESEERYRSLYNNINDGLALHELVYNKDGEPVNFRILDVNPAFERITGIAASEACNTLASSIFGDESLAHLEICARVVQSGNPETFETYFSSIGKHIRISAFCPSPEQFATLFTDITARKETQNALEDAFSEIQRLKERLEAENIYLRQEVQSELGHGEIIGESDVVVQMLKNARLVAPTDSVVLITGETGTGKEVLAQVIHDQSPRSDHAMVKINCASIPPTLVESELFGREKGAYTGALTRSPGRFEVADGSTIFLDEIGELPLELQVKLLRVLESGEFERLGSHQTLTVNVRLIAATNRNLEKMVREGTFRSDLFYRLNVFPIHVPSLQERRDDIPLLVWHFVRYFSNKTGRLIDTISRETMLQLQNYDWPGNIRELRNVIERAVIMSTGPKLVVDLPNVENIIQPELTTLEDVERNHILQVLKQTKWRISGSNGAAKILNIKPTTLHARLKKLGISRPS